MLAYSTLAHPESLQESPSSKLFRLTKFWVHKIEFPAHHKKLVKNKKNSLYKQENWPNYSGGKVTVDCHHKPDETLPHTKGGAISQD